MIGEEDIECTSGHPFLLLNGEDASARPTPHELGYRSTKEGRWVAAARLQAGDTLLATADRKLTVTSIEARHERTWVYNLTVAGTHTYTVGTAGVVTHNNSLGDGCKTAADIVPGSLKRNFPSEHLDKTLQEIKDLLSSKSFKGEALRKLKRAKKIMEEQTRLLEKSKG